MNSSLRQQNITLTGYFYLSLLLVVYVVWRSISISFTHDECLSYTIVTGNEAQVYTANNHWLNTILMFISSRIFGASEFALRLPNVIAFIVYLFFIYRIFYRHCENVIALIIAIPVFLFNPFILDFFGMARGYGLGMAFFTMSFYYSLAYFQKQQSLKYLALLILSSICCVYSNYSFLTAILALQGTALIFHFKIHRAKIKQLILFYLLEGMLLIPAVLNILYLSEKNELYVGGENNVFHDTLKSIISYSFSYGDDHYNLTLIACILLAISFVGGILFFKNKPLNFIKLNILVLLLIPTVLHLAIGMKYPKDRAAIYWMITAGFFILFAADAVLQKTKLSKSTGFATKITFLPVLVFCSVSVLQIINFIPNFNFTHTIIWQYDSDVENAIEEVAKKANKHAAISIGCSWFVEPPLNYYRETKNLSWLRPVHKETSIAGEYDYYLIFKEDFPSLKDLQFLRIKYYPNSGLYLMERIN